MLLPGFGAAGQQRLLAAHATVVGVGALGCAAADMLARAGVGRITLIDRDVVELTNLQRQTLFDESDAAEGLPKAEAARRRLSRINSRIGVVAEVADLTARNAERLLSPRSGGPAVLLDGTDNFETRYLLNDISVRHGIPYVYGGAVGTRGLQMAVIPPPDSSGQRRVRPCLRCVFEDPPAPGTAPTCDTAGVLGPVIASVAAAQAADAIRVLLGLGDQVPAGLLEIDLWEGVHRRLNVGAARPDCPCCGLGKFEFLDGRGAQAMALCGQDAIQIAPASETRLDLGALAERLAPHGEFKQLGGFLVRGELRADRPESGPPLRLTVFADGRAIINGTARPEIARAVYARYIGA